MCMSEPVRAHDQHPASPFFAKVRVAGSNPVVRSAKVLVDSLFRGSFWVSVWAVAHGLPMVPVVRARFILDCEDHACGRMTVLGWSR